MSNTVDSEEEQALIDQIQEEIKKIRQCKTLIDNNENRNDIYSPLSKALIENNTFKMALESETLTGCSVTKLNPIDDFLGDLKREIEFIQSDILKIVKRTKECEDANARLMKNADNLELMLAASNSVNGPSKRLDLIERNIKQRFLKEKKELKKIITTLFPDNLDIQDLIAQITEFYFTEGADKYMEIEDSDNVPEQIEFLLRMEMFEVNPNNPKQIRLANLL